MFLLNTYILTEKSTHRSIYFLKLRLWTSTLNGKYDKEKSDAGISREYQLYAAVYTDYIRGVESLTIWMDSRYSAMTNVKITRYSRE